MIECKSKRLICLFVECPLFDSRTFISQWTNKATTQSKNKQTSLKLFTLLLLVFNVYLNFLKRCIPCTNAWFWPASILARFSQGKKQQGTVQKQNTYRLNCSRPFTCYQFVLKKLIALNSINKFMTLNCQFTGIFSEEQNEQGNITKT